MLVPEIGQEISCGQVMRIYNFKVEDEHATSESFDVMCDTHHSVAIMKHTFILAVPELSPVYTCIYLHLVQRPQLV